MMTNLKLLIGELVKLPTEMSWVEFKHNNFKPDMIGEDVCALANSAAIEERECAYMIWGVDDTTHEVLGCREDLQNVKVGNEELENWLRHQLSENADFEFGVVEYEGERVAVLKVAAAIAHPVSFKGVSYVRIGSYTKKLHNYPEVESRLWDRLRNLKFEDQSAKSDLPLVEAVRLLDVGVYFDVTQTPYPTTTDGVGKILSDEGVLIRQDDGLYSITNLGAALFAKRYDEFPAVSRKAVRVIQYRGENRMEMMREMPGSKGYAVGFEGLINYIMALTPSDEPIVGGVRSHVTAYPEVVIRELVANALIHQDFSIRGTGPLIEVFSNRIEITNPGKCLVDIARIVDSPPRSRNEHLAALMRRMRMCEEAGSGWDKVVLGCEAMCLPAPKIALYEENVRVTIWSKVSFSSMSQEERVWGCYMHACIQYVQGQCLTNASLRKRFGLNEQSAGNASRVIKEAVNEKLIRAFDPNTAPKYMKYVPFWA